MIRYILLPALLGAALCGAAENIAGSNTAEHLQIKTTRKWQEKAVPYAPRKWIHFSPKGKYFMLVDHKVNWTTARRECRKHFDAQLARVSSAEERDFLTETYRTKEDAIYWFGLKFHVKYEEFSWNGGPDWDGYDWGFGKEMSGPFYVPDNINDIPNRVAFEDSCYGIYPDSPYVPKKNVGKWVDRSCREEAYFICEKPESGVQSTQPVTTRPPKRTTPPPIWVENPWLPDDQLVKLYEDLNKRHGGDQNWRRLGGKSYKAYRIKMTQKEAKKACAKVGDGLAYIKSGKKAKQLTRQYPFKTDDHQQYWVTDGRWRFRSSKSSFCDVLIPRKGLKTVMKSECNDRKYFICEKRNRSSYGPFGDPFGDLFEEPFGDRSDVWDRFDDMMDSIFKDDFRYASG